MSLNTNEIQLLKNLLLGKNPHDVASLIGLDISTNPFFANTVSVFREEDFERFNTEIISAYKQSIKKPEFQKLKNKIVVNAAKSGILISFLHFYKPEPQVKKANSRKKNSGATALQSKKKKKKVGQNKPEIKDNNNSTNRLEAYINEIEALKQRQTNQHDGVYYFLNVKLKPFYNKQQTISEFEKSFGIYPGHIRLYLLHQGEAVSSNDIFTFEIASLISNKLYEVYLENKLAESNEVANLARTMKKIAKTLPNYYKLIFTR